MKRSLVTISVLTLITVMVAVWTHWNAVGDPVPHTSDWKSYEDAIRGFGFAYPPDILCGAREDGAVCPDPQNGMWLLDIRLKPTDETGVQEWLEHENAKREDGGFIRASRMMVVNGHEAIVTSQQPEMGVEPDFTRPLELTLYAIRNGTLYAASVRLGGAENDRFLASFRFLK